MIRGGLCEECSAKGEEVHHIIPLTEKNMDDFDISLNEKNLQLLCKSCHNAKRNSGLIREDLEFDEEGNIVQRKKTPPSFIKKNI
jgi:5-methylcytosine-specific restriction endonuclease McrA